VFFVKDDAMSDVDTAETGAQVVPEAKVTEQAEAEKTEQVEGEQSESTTDELEPQKHRKKDSVQKRINELTAEKWAEKREKEQLARELDEIRQRMYQPQQSQQAPKLEDFGYDTEAYQQAVFQYAQAKTQEQAQAYFEQQRQQEAQYQEQRRFESLMQEHNAREAKFVKAVPDYNEAVEYLVSNIQFNKDLVEVIGESDRSPDILYYLATNFDEAANIADMPPHRAAAHIARLEAKLANKQAKPVTKAPPPAPTLTGATEVKKSIDNKTTEERIKFWNEQERKKR
jgi:hypothetical protein